MLSEALRNIDAVVKGVFSPWCNESRSIPCQDAQAAVNSNLWLILNQVWSGHVFI